MVNDEVISCISYYFERPCLLSISRLKIGCIPSKSRSIEPSHHAMADESTNGHLDSDKDSTDPIEDPNERKENGVIDQDESMRVNSNSPVAELNSLVGSPLEEDAVVDSDDDVTKRRLSDGTDGGLRAKRLRIDSQSPSPLTGNSKDPDSDSSSESGLTSPLPLPKETIVSNNDNYGGQGIIRFYLPIDMVNSSPIIRHTRDIRITSKPLNLRELPWCILVVRKMLDRNLGLFVQCDPPMKNDYLQWSCQARATISLINHNEGEESVTRDLCYEFTTRTNDWGYACMKELSTDFLDEKSGWVRDGRILLEALITADAPHSMGWDSKVHSGYVGLRNQGATCYMNSLLQSLFYTNILRNAVYQMPTQDHDTNLSVALGMQRLFYELQHSDKVVSTKKLTRAFGWKTLDTFMQHDVQEMCRVLLDNLEAAMKKTCVDGTIPRILEGKMESYIKCTQIDYMSSREETFFDIQLNVKGISHICDSFKDYIAPEILEGDNKYDAGDHGFQQAEKGVHFLTFPPVLHLHLMRFQFDPHTNLNDKINDRCEFPDQLDLTKFLKVPSTNPLIYRLHTVLVHTGDNNGGHYVAYLNPKCDENWYKFDDEIVFRCSKEEAIENNFGGFREHHNNRFCTNAYMLVYVCENMLSEILKEVNEADIPQYLHERIEQEKQADALKRKERQEAHLYLRVDVYTDKQFEQHHGFDLIADFIEPQLTLTVKKDTSIEVFHQDLAERFECTTQECRIWPVRYRYNESFRPTMFSHFLSEGSSVWEHSERSTTWRIYLEILEDKTCSLSDFDTKDDVLLFLKYFDVFAQRINYVGSHIFQIQSNFSEICPFLCKMVGLSESCELRLFEEVTFGQIVSLDMESNICSIHELTDGDIICYQPATFDNSLIKTLPFRQPCLSAEVFLEDMSMRLNVLFKQFGTTDECGFIMQLRKDLRYHEMSEIIGEVLHVDHEKIQFFRSSYYTDIISDAFKHDCNSYLVHMVSSRYLRNEEYTILYKILDITVAELANKLQIKCHLLSPQSTVERNCQLYVDKIETIGSILDRCKKQFEIDAENLRAFHVVSSKISKVFTSTDAQLSNLRPPSLYLERIPSDYVEVLDDRSILVQVMHFNKTLSNYFGIPFLIQLTEEDSVGDIKKKIQQKLTIADVLFKRFKLALIHDSIITYYEDDSVILHVEDFKIKPFKLLTTTLSHCSSQRWSSIYFGLDHIDRQKHRSFYTERGIKIYN